MNTPNLDLTGKVAVVTGAGRGIGRAEAMGLAAAGAKVVVNDLGCTYEGMGASSSPADKVVDEIKKQGGIAIANYDSVASFEGGKKIIEMAVKNFGAIHILVNNAGIVRPYPMFETPEEEWDAVIKVHLYGSFYCARAASITMREQRWGRIINTSSIAGLGWVMGNSNYAAAKEGIVGFTRTIARELGKYGITCNAIRPGASTRLITDPQLRARNMAAAGGQVIKDRKDHPKEEGMSPECVAPLVVYLASDIAANINGCVLQVEGGEIGIFPEPEPVKTIFKKGKWTVEELASIMPGTIEKGLINPSPPLSDT